MKYTEFLATVFSAITDNVVHSRLHQNYIISLLCAV